jgi:hypothetical protein
MRRALQERADTAALAGEGDEALGGARVAADAGEAMGEDAAVKTDAEVVLDPLRDTVAIKIPVAASARKISRWYWTTGGRGIS